MLKAKNLQKSFGDLHVLKGVNLTVKRGEIISIVGKSGSGKSTLLHILGTLDQADSGYLEIAGQPIKELSDKVLAYFRNHKIGFVFQFHHLLPEFTALENVCIPAYIQKMNASKVKQRGTELITYLGLLDRKDHKPNELSGGEQQRVAVARALMNNPEIIFADEPSGNLDQDTSEELHNLLFRLRKDFNQSFVIATHNLDLARLSDRCLTLSEGVLQE